jgi:hypothetical protein
MDFGLGGSNQRVGDLTARALLQSTRVQEAAVQQELERCDAVLNNEDALAALRSRRLKQMQDEQRSQQKWRAAGHGSYRELVTSKQDTRDVAQEFFGVTKESERVVVHFYRPSTHLCDVFHKHMEKLAVNHMETRFVKLNVEDCDTESGKGASFLVEKLGVVIMPTLVLIHKRKAVHHVRGFDELGGTEDFSTPALARLLVSHNVLRPRNDDEEDNGGEDEAQESWYDKRKGVNAIRVSRNRRDKEEEDEEY